MCGSVRDQTHRPVLPGEIKRISSPVDVLDSPVIDAGVERLREGDGVDIAPIVLGGQPSEAHPKVPDVIVGVGISIELCPQRIR
jgi:hypothetical protein